MQLDDRSMNLLKEVINTPGMKSAEIEAKYGLSRRQVGYSFDKINDWLKAGGMPAIEKNRQGVFIVNAKLHMIFERQEKKPAQTYTASEAERVDLILLMLLGRSEEIALVHLTSALMVSKNTILSDLKAVQKSLEPYGLTNVYTRSQGYRIDGAEFDKRRLLIDVVSRILGMFGGADWIRRLAAVTDEELLRFRQRMENVERKLNLRFTDEKLESTTYALILILRRIRQQKKIGSFHIGYKELSDTNEYRAVEELLADLDHIPTEERLFITLQLLTVNVSSSEVLTDQSIPALRESIDKMLERFETLACLTLEDKELLVEKLLLHVKPVYYRIKYKLTLSNPLQETFIWDTFHEEFRDVHRLLKKSTAALETLIGCEIPEGERVYLTMLVGGWIKKQGGDGLPKLKALVVCPNGISISRLMQVTLKELFPEFIFMDAISVREFERYDRAYDLVFSSVYLKTDKKLCMIHPVLEQKEKIRIRKQVMQDIYGYSLDTINLERIMEIIKKHAVVKDTRPLYKALRQYFATEHIAPHRAKRLYAATKPNLGALLQPGHIVLDRPAAHWEQALRLAEQPLLAGGYIAPSYVETIIKRYRAKFPYILFGNDIAIPHGVPEDGVHKIGMSLVRLNEGVAFSGKDVRLVVLVAAVDRELHLRVLLQLAKLAENKKQIKALLSAKHPEEMLAILNQYTE